MHCARSTASTGSRRCARRRSASWSRPGPSKGDSSMSATCSSSPIRTSPASDSSPAGIRSWPADGRAQRSRLLEATARELEKVRRMVTGGRPLQGQEPIGKRVRQVARPLPTGPTLSAADSGGRFRVSSREKRRSLPSWPKRQPRARRWRKEDASVTPVIARRSTNSWSTLRQRIQRGRLYGKEHIGVRVGKVLNKYKVGKALPAAHRGRSIRLRDRPGEGPSRSGPRYGLYVVRTSLPKETLDAASDGPQLQTPGLSVERAFRSFKTMDAQGPTHPPPPG